MFQAITKKGGIIVGFGSIVVSLRVLEITDNVSCEARGPLRRSRVLTRSNLFHV